MQEKKRRSERNASGRKNEYAAKEEGGQGDVVAGNWQKEDEEGKKKRGKSKERGRREE